MKLVVALLGLLAFASQASAKQPIKYQYRTVGFVNGQPVVVAVPVRAVYDQNGFRRYEPVGPGDSNSDPEPAPPRPTLGKYGGGASATYSRSYVPQSWERNAPKPSSVTNPYVRPK